MFCQNCGQQLNDNTKFCPNCGAVQNTATQQAEPPVYTQPFGAPVYAGNGAVRQCVPTPGFSDRVNDPEILAAVKKSRKAAKIFTLFFVPLPFIGFVIYSLVTGKVELPQAALYGGILSAVFLVFALFSFIRERAENTYEATVIDKKSHLTYHHKNSSGQDTIMEYIVVARTNDGKKKKIIEHEGSQIWAYNYLNVGDHFKYHPQFHFPYELYDKSRAPYIACIRCGTQNPVEADRCKRCNLPLLK